MKGIILAGGIGSRLWPISTNTKPKQFLKLFSSKSLFQLTLLRNSFLGKLTVMINKENYTIAKTQIEEVGIEADIIVEPIRKNTAASSILAILHARFCGEKNIALIPSDHFVSDESTYQATIRKAIDFLPNYDLMALGVTPLRFNSDYGYIEAYEKICDVLQVANFKEKPSNDKKAIFSDKSYYYWNTGIYMFDVDNFAKYASKCDPFSVFSITQAYENAVKEENTIYINRDFFRLAGHRSFDTAFSEKIKRMGMIEAKFDWTDLGNWSSLFEKIDNHNDNQVNNSLESILSSEADEPIIVKTNNIIAINKFDQIVISERKSYNKIFKTSKQELKNRGLRQILEEEKIS